MEINSVTTPALEHRHVRGARLYANRQVLLANVGCTPGGIVTEVGVALGDFSQVILDIIHPRLFVAIDTFEMHKWPVHWGRSSKEIFGGLTHEEFYRRRFAERRSQLSVRRGRSVDVLRTFHDFFFDMIYLDAGHDYDSVKADAAVSASKLALDGVLIFNDYTLFDPFLNVPYGVVRAVNEMVVSGEWEVSAFALERNMFCDIALRRATT